MTASGAQVQELTFFVAGQEFGVEILRVQEIRGWSSPMPVPNSPAWIKGVINLRGDIVPLADLRERLGFPAVPYGEMTVVVVLKARRANQEQIIGVIVDAMSDVVAIDAVKVRAAPESCGAEAHAIARGIATIEERMITLLDVDRLFGNVESTSVQGEAPGRAA